MNGEFQQLSQQLREISQRVQRLEDEREILHIIASYFPLADAGLASQTAELWEENGCYQVDSRRLQPASAIAQMISSAPHQELIARGSAHIAGIPHITLSGDSAVATGHSVLLAYGGSPYNFKVLRATANRWKLSKASGHWKVVHRSAQLLDDSQTGRRLFAETFTDDQA